MPRYNRLHDLFEATLDRRAFLGGTAAAGAAAAVLGPRAFAAGSVPMGFAGVPVDAADRVQAPSGYVVRTLIAWGDPLSDGPAFRFDASNDAADQAVQYGMHCDGMWLFPLRGRGGLPSADHGLLVVNHEYVDNGLLFPDGQATWSAEKVAKSQAAHGVSVLEVRRRRGAWEVVRPSRYARRITAATPMEIGGPVRGSPLVRTAADPAGTRVLGTLANCAHGVTPWGTYLTCEENFHNYFAATQRGAPEVRLVPGREYSAAERARVIAATDGDSRRYGIGLPVFAETARGSGRFRFVEWGLGHRWHEHDERFDASLHPNEPNRFGWVVEIDPEDPASVPVKRTALGRSKHESATVTLARDGRVVVYTGDDERDEYLYKFVSTGRYEPARGKANAALLDEGTLYVARFEAGNRGEWRPLVHGRDGLTRDRGWIDQADVLVRARLAGDTVGGTRLDRPEWVAVRAETGEAYVSLTNHTRRTETDAANPRAPNPYGHVLRWREAGGDAAATEFEWEVFVLAGDPRVAREDGDPAKAGDVRGDAFGSPDGLWVDARGRVWISTDVSPTTLYEGDYRHLGNNALLCADPVTREVRRFLTGPRACEITGVFTTPDGTALFVNVQHPGEPPRESSDPAEPRRISNWPDFRPDGRPRSSTLVVTRRDGGEIGT